MLLCLSLLCLFFNLSLSLLSQKTRKTASSLYVNGFGDVMANLNAKVLMQNAERLARNEHEQCKGRLQVLAPLPLVSLQKSLKDGTNLVHAVLLRDGVVSLKGAISSSTADTLFNYVNKEKVIAEEEIVEGRADYDNRFGAVNNRGPMEKSVRYDMFLSYNSLATKTALFEAVQNLNPLLHAIDGMLETGSLHELSCIISDPGSKPQVIHCDTPYLEKVSPLYTFFIALQDVEIDMGHTLFFPATHNKAVHSIFNGPIRQKDELMGSLPCVRSALKKGDVVIFDSRVLHAGGANTSNGSRRILFYFTFTAGDVEKNNPNPSRGTGSIRDIDRLKHTLKSIERDIVEEMHGGKT